MILLVFYQTFVIVIIFNLFNILSIFVFKFLALILPFITLIFVFNFVFIVFNPLNFIIVHVLLKPFLPPWHEIDFFNNFIRKTTQIKKYNDKVRLFTSLMNLFWFHASIVIHFIVMTIFNQVLSLLNVSSDIVEFGTVFWIRKNIVPWSTLTRLLWI